MAHQDLKGQEVRILIERQEACTGQAMRFLLEIFLRLSPQNGNKALVGTCQIFTALQRNQGKRFPAV